MFQDSGRDDAKKISNMQKRTHIVKPFKYRFTYGSWYVNTWRNNKETQGKDKHQSSDGIYLWERAEEEKVIGEVFTGGFNYIGLNWVVSMGIF